MSQITRLLNIMKRLRDPETGCPWDKEQTFATIAPYTPGRDLRSAGCHQPRGF